MVRMVFAEMQPFKGVENYFTDSLLYKENGRVVKKLLPDDIDNGNEVDSESGEDPTVSFDGKMIVAYLNDLIVITLPTIATNGFLMKMSISIISCVMMM